MIASENFTTTAVLESLASCLHNKYSEGLPGARYYGGNEHIDEVSHCCTAEAAGRVALAPQDWRLLCAPQLAMLCSHCSVFAWVEGSDSRQLAGAEPSSHWDSS